MTWRCVARWVTVARAQVDVYAFAVLLNELLTGRSPWQGLALYQVTMAVAINKERPEVRVVSMVVELVARGAQC